MYEIFKSVARRLFSDRFIAYNTLNLLSNALARRLFQLYTRSSVQEIFGEQGAGGNGEPRRSTFKLNVVVDIDPSVGLVVGLLAIMKLGLAYVPVDSRSTAINRIKYILQVSHELCINSLQSINCLGRPIYLPCFFFARTLHENINLREDYDRPLFQLRLYRFQRRWYFTQQSKH